MRLGAAAAAIGIVLLAAACGSSSKSSSAAVDRTCAREPAAVAGLGPVRNLGDAMRVLGAVVRIERRTLDDLTAAGGHEQLTGRLRLSMDGAKRSLAAISVADPQQTMTPVRTGVPDARRAAAQAGSLLHALCAAANA